MDAGEDPRIGTSATSHLSSFCAASTLVVSKFTSRAPAPPGVAITNTVRVAPTTSITSSSTAIKTTDVSGAPTTTSSTTSTASMTVSAKVDPWTLETLVPEFPPQTPY